MSLPTTRASQPAPRALTLIEMLIGMAITLVMMAAVVNLFANIGAGVRFRRAGMEMNGQLRIARARLFKDMAGATCDGIPKSSPGDDDKADGYIEIVEGQWSDKKPSRLTDGIDDAASPELDYAASLVPSGGDPATVPPLIATAGAVTNGRGLGDYDDILALTVRSESEPFVGRWINAAGNVETIESDLAEVIWFAVENPADDSLGEPGMRTVYRRVLLIAPWVRGDLQTPGGANLPTDLLAFYRENDISVRLDNTGTVWVPNELSDLVKRENRFGHFLDSTGAAIGYPFAINQQAIQANSYDPATPPATVLGPLRPHGVPFDIPTTEERTGEDVMMNNVLAFDLRVFDPGAPLYEQPATKKVLEPSDAGWDTEHTGPATVVGYGAFVDLYWNRTGTALPTGALIPEPLFDVIASTKSELTITAPPAAFASIAYDTGSFHYENDKLDQDDTTGNDNVNDNILTTGLVDEGTNGLDDDNVNGTDDVGEREAPPPYDVPLRGIQVKLRIYEPDSRQIREATVTRNFVSD